MWLGHLKSRSPARKARSCEPDRSKGAIRRNPLRHSGGGEECDDSWPTSPAL